MYISKSIGFSLRLTNLNALQNAKPQPLDKSLIITPPFPVLTIYRGNRIDILNGEHPLNQTSLYSYINQGTDKNIYYDKDGFKWTSTIYSRKYRPTLLRTLLANAFYNPTISIERIWTRMQNYELPELIEKVNNCIDSDDDVLTQFIGASALKAKMNNCNSFEDIVKVLFDCVFKPNPKAIDGVSKP